jgi:hypothetical protein
MCRFPAEPYRQVGFDRDRRRATEDLIHQESRGGKRRGDSQALVSRRKVERLVAGAGADEGELVGRGCAKPVQVRIAASGASRGMYRQARSSMRRRMLGSTPLSSTSNWRDEPLTK